MGLKWKCNVQSDSDLPEHHLKQTTFQIVLPSATLTKLFSNVQFKNKFLEYNEQKRQFGCTDGIYKDYCCGKLAKEFEDFQSNDIVILQFGSDEFDVANPIKSKAVIHKTFAVYFTIRNMPAKYASRLENIYLAALCNSSNFKEKWCSEDDVIREIVRDLREIEINGIDIGNNKRLRVAVFDIQCDNLGANVLFGFSGGFSANHFCRFCTCSKDQTQLMTTENVSKIRTVNSYDDQIARLKACPELDLKETKGIKKNCFFNELKNFHVCQNISGDIMHDIFEGLIPYFLKNFIKYCMDKKICNENDIIRRVRDFNYGTLNSKNKPSRLRVGKKHLGQNATQYRCIMLHLPFIFFDKQEPLKDVWPVMESLLHIMRILFSYEISESDLEFLNRCVQKHLSGMINVFEITLKPKHHNLLHYARIVRTMGPVRYSWMMKYEAKHKFFTDIAKTTNNFQNITKTLAETHQAYICTRIDSFEDRIEPSKKKHLIVRDMQYNIYRSFINNQQIDVNNSYALNFIKVNGIMYRMGYLVYYDRKFFEIRFIIESNATFSLLCHAYEFIKFDSSLNSVEIKATHVRKENLKIINIDLLNDSFEKKMHNGCIYVIAENLEMLKTQNNPM